MPEPDGDIVEDCRTLREFYPDPDERGQLHYLFAHRFLPGYFFHNPRGVVRPDSDCDRTQYIQARWQMMEWRLGLVERPRWEGSETFRRVTDLRGSLEFIAGFPALLIEMPVPETTPQAYFVTAALTDPTIYGPQHAGGRYLTLELMTPRVGAPTRAIVCGWTDGGTKHENHGIQLSPPSREQFLSIAASFLGTPPDS